MKAPTLITPAQCRGVHVFHGDTFHLAESTGAVVVARCMPAQLGGCINAYDVVNGFEEKSAFISHTDCDKYDGICQSSKYIICYNTKTGTCYCYENSTMRCVGFFHKKLSYGQSILKVCVVSSRSRQQREQELFLLYCSDDLHVQAFMPRDNDNVKDNAGQAVSYNIIYSYGVAFSPFYRLATKMSIVEMASTSTLLMLVFKENLKYTAIVDVWDFESTIARFYGEEGDDKDIPRRIGCLEQGIGQAASGNDPSAMALHPSGLIAAVLWGGSIAIYELRGAPPHRPARVLSTIDSTGVRSPALQFHPKEQLLYHIYSHISNSVLLIKVCLHSLAMDTTQTMVDHFNFDLSASLAAAGLRDASLCLWCSFLPWSAALVAYVEGAEGTRAAVSAVATAVPGLRQVSLTVSKQTHPTSSGNAAKDAFFYIDSSSNSLQGESLGVYSLELPRASAAKIDWSAVCSFPTCIGGDVGPAGLAAEDLFGAKGHFQPLRVRANPICRGGPLLALLRGRLSHYSRNEISMTDTLCVDTVVVMLLRSARPTVCSFLDAEFCLLNSEETHSYFVAITKSGRHLKLYSFKSNTSECSVVRSWGLTVSVDSLYYIPCRDDIASNKESLKFVFSQTVQKSDQKVIVLSGENSFEIDPKATPSFKFAKEERLLDIETCSDLAEARATSLIAALTSARLVVFTAGLEPTLALHFLQGRPLLSTSFSPPRDQVFYASTYEAVTAVKWRAFSKLVLISDRGGVFRVDTPSGRGSAPARTRVTDFTSFGMRVNSPQIATRVTTVPREEGCSLSCVEVLRMWRHCVQFVSMGAEAVSTLVATQRLSFLEEMLADLVDPAPVQAPDWEAGARAIEAAIATEDVLFKNVSRALCQRLYTSPSATSALGKLPIAMLLFDKCQTLPYSFRLGCRLLSMVAFDADYSGLRNSCTSNLYQATALRIGGADADKRTLLRLLGIESHLDLFCERENVNVAAALVARRSTFFHFYRHLDLEPVYKSQITLDNKTFPKQSLSALFGDAGRPLFCASSAAPLFSSDDSCFVEDFAGLRLLLQRRQGGTDEGPVRPKESFAGDTTRSGWVKDVGRGKEHERVVGYWRFSDVRPEAATRSFVDLSRFANILTFDAGKKEFSVEETQSPLDCGDDHAKVKHLCDLVFHNPSPGACCDVLRGGPLDVGFFHTDTDRSSMTIEITTSFVSSASARPAKDNVLLCRRLGSGQALWRLIVDGEGSVVFCLCGGEALSTPTGAVCVVSKEGAGASWTHIAVVVSAVDETSEDEEAIAVPRAYSVTICVDGEISAETVLRVMTLPTELELATTRFEVGAGLGAGWRLTELRVWAEARARMDLERLREEFLPHAAKRKRLQLKLACGKDFFKPFDEAILSL